jgi:hypothetical protein
MARPVRVTAASSQQQLQPPAAYSFSIDRRSIDSIV